MHDQTARKRQEQEDDGDTPHDLLSPKARFEVANFVRLRDAISKEKGSQSLRAAPVFDSGLRPLG